MPSLTHLGQALWHAQDARRSRWMMVALVALLAGAFVGGHVPVIRGTQDGVDSVNFILAVNRYDLHSHQPHPPGFPVYIALARVGTSAVQKLAPAGSSLATVPGSLRLLSVVSGGLALVTLLWIARGLGLPASRGTLVAALTAACPLFWLTAMRPLSDVTGLFFSMLSQALALASYTHEIAPGTEAVHRGDSPVRGRLPYRLLGAAAVAGIAVGIRVQTALLTVPLLALVTVLLARRHGAAIIGRVSLVFVAGLLVWVVPLLRSAGGPAEYLRLLSTVAASDVQGVEMLATDPNPRLLALALFRTVILPWSSQVLGWSMVLLAAAGAIRSLRHNPRVIGFLTLMAVPYCAFHLAFQETVSLRYAVPLVPIVCFLVIEGLSSPPARLGGVVATALLVFALSSSLKAATEYGISQSPVASVVEDVTRAFETSRTVRTIAFHHSVAQAVRGEVWPGTVLRAPVSYEWLELARYWLKGGREPVWFLADPRRTDLELIDPVSRRLARSYGWSSNLKTLLGGVQPLAVNWHEIVLPGWFAMRGWALTPETRGVSSRDGHAPGTTGTVAHIRRRQSEATMMIGGRNLGGPCDTGASIEVSVDGRRRAAWVANAHTPFLQVIRFAPGELEGHGAYATVTVTARDAVPTARLVDVAIEYFDVQSPGAALAGFDRGWYMPELETATGLGWRWTQDLAELRVEGFGRDLELVIRGESPLRYFATPPRVVLRAGSSELASYRPDADFTWVIKVPAAALAANDGRVVLESDQSFIPHERTGNGDLRRLALRIFDVEVRPSPAQ